MTVSQPSLDHVDFYGGPPGRFEQWIGLKTTGDQRLRRRAVFVLVATWAPLAILTVLRDITEHGNALHSFLLDAGNYARYFIAAPLCIIAEPFSAPRFKRIIVHFRNSGFISAADRERYENYVISSCRLLKSRAVEIVAFVIAYAATAILILHLPASIVPDWQLVRKDAGAVLSAAGWWHAVISAPLLMVLLLGWAWRYLLWARLLWLLARLDLQIIPSHPDHCCGLKFVSTSLRGYGPLGFACSSIIAGGIANRMIFYGESSEAYYHLMLIIVVLIVFVFVVPLTTFAPLLRTARARAVFEYGALAKNVGREFEHKWISRRDRIDLTDLETSDFSATTDLYSVVANVYSIGYLPVTLRTLEELLVIATLPFVPIVLTVIPLAKIFASIAKLVI